MYNAKVLSGSPIDTHVTAKLDQIAQCLIDWQQKHGRHHLPWQHQSAYHVWISEIMLQQTQVATVVPFYNRFIQRFPDVDTLAHAALDEVLVYWAGLGYYSRANHIHKAAQLIISDFQSRLPQSIEALQSLPGIGRSTAGAILSLGYQQSAPILDGNVKRMLARLFEISEPLNSSRTMKQLWQLSESITPHHQCHIFTQATMDLGATVCTKKAPHCQQCPINHHCLSHKHNSVDTIPVKPVTIKKTPLNYYLIFIKSHCKKRILMKKRALGGIWGGLYCPLIFEDPSEQQAWLEEHKEQLLHITALGEHRHQLTHKRLYLSSQLVTLDKSLSDHLESEFTGFNDASEIATPKPIATILRNIYEQTQDCLLPET